MNHFWPRPAEGAVLELTICLTFNFWPPGGALKKHCAICAKIYKFKLDGNKPRPFWTSLNLLIYYHVILLPNNRGFFMMLGKFYKFILGKGYLSAVLDWKPFQSCLNYQSNWSTLYEAIHSKQLTKREELSFLAVLALPKASKIGLVCTIWSSSDAFLADPFFSPRAPTKAKYEMTFFVFSVLPAPDSPLQKWMKISAKIQIIRPLMETTNSRNK